MRLMPSRVSKGDCCSLQTPRNTNRHCVGVATHPLALCFSPSYHLFPATRIQTKLKKRTQNATRAWAKAYTPQDALRHLSGSKAGRRTGPGSLRSAHLGAPRAFQHLLSERDYIGAAGVHFLREKPLHRLTKSGLRIRRPSRHHLN